MSFRPTLLAACTVAAGAFALTAAAQAQQASPGYQGQAPAPQGAVQSEFSDQQLQSFAGAVREVQKIGQRMQPKVSAAGSPEEAAEVRQEATKEMVEAIRGEGLTVEEYNDISTAARANPQLAARITEMIRGN